ncbi:30S ribosomal protein S13 [Patescibacteria group bacterium]|nr:30S ribosomal protein S13 [Patescibacteria group bacterium]
MVRIAGVTIPDQKRIEFALPYIYGIGLSMSRKILESSKVNKSKTTKDLTAEEVSRIRSLIEHDYAIEGELRRQVASNIKRLKEIKSYRGTRHLRGLPVRGQRTRTNSRTRRGNVRRTTTSGKRKAEKK